MERWGMTRGMERGSSTSNKKRTGRDYRNSVITVYDGVGGKIEGGCERKRVNSIESSGLQIRDGNIR